MKVVIDTNVFISGIFWKGKPNEVLMAWKDLMITNSIIVEPTEKVHVVLEDAGDDKFIEAAVTGKVDYIISGDSHLKKIGEYSGIRIVSPKDFLDIL